MDWGEQQPARLAPTRLKGHALEIDPMCDTPIYDLMKKMQWQLAMEQERLVRLLPPAPFGHTWRFEQQMSEDNQWGSFMFRVVAYLEPGYAPWEVVD